MKTIKIPDDLHKLLKVRAAELDRNLQELTEDALRKGLQFLPHVSTKEAKGELPRGKLPGQ